MSIQISKAELEIMQVIWKERKEMAYAQIFHAAGRKTRQSTQTLINRLVNKGILKQEKREVYYYTPTVTKEEYTYAKTKELINLAYSGSARDLIVALVKQREVSPEDFEELKHFWTEGVDQI